MVRLGEVEGVGRTGVSILGMKWGEARLEGGDESERSAKKAIVFVLDTPEAWL